MRRKIAAVILVCGLGLLPILEYGLNHQAYAQESSKFAFEAVDLNGGTDLMLARAAGIDLTLYPIVPESVGRAKTIAQQGQTNARDSRVLSKVGDCNSTAWVFLHPFGEEQYALGDYSYLQNVVDYFGESFAYQTYAAHNGLNVQGALDPIWSDPNVCQPGETPLVCEYRVHNPSIAVIMFGTNDMLVLTPAQFDYNLRRVVSETVQAGVIPLVSTFPRHLAFPKRSILFNQIVVRVALDFNVPLMNLWLALESLPNYGIAEDEFHLNGPVTRAADFTSEANLASGHPMRNLVTLQALDVIIREVFET